MSRKLRFDPWAKAASPIYIVLCKDGSPHPEGHPHLSSQRADISRDACALLCPTCSPHRVQAYRPMR